MGYFVNQQTNKKQTKGAKMFGIDVEQTKKDIAEQIKKWSPAVVAFSNGIKKNARVAMLANSASIIYAQKSQKQASTIKASVEAAEKIVEEIERREK